MNRKLHHSMMAALVCTAAFAVVLLASTPIESAPLPTVAGNADAAPTAPHHATAARSHQSVRMPFFSFFIPKG